MQEHALSGGGDNFVETLLHSIGMFDQVANKPKLNSRIMAEFAERKLAFDWLHMGNSETTVGRLFEVLGAASPLQPARTGHVGNWSDIVRGCAGPRDYNYLVCGRNQLGYPLLFDFNQTESDDAGGGDWVYLPGSLLNGAKREVLNLFTWNGREFKHRSRDRSYFTPFTLTDLGGHLVPLIALHMDSCMGYEGFSFCRQSSLLAKHETLVRQILLALISDALRQEQPEQLLRLIIDRSVTLEGGVSRGVLNAVGTGLRLDNKLYRSPEELVEHSMLPLLIAAKPESLKGAVTSLPGQMPLISAPLLVLLLAVLNSHYPGTESVSRGMSYPCNPHFHWGGTSMAGHPPHYRGYFGDSARHLRKLFRSVIAHVDEVDPVFLVLLPATIFNLCPHSFFVRDIELVAMLIDRIHAATDHLIGRPEEIARAIDQIATDWMYSSRDLLSDYFLSRMEPRQVGFARSAIPTDGQPVLLENFMNLTLQQASMTVGALCCVRKAACEMPRSRDLSA